MQKFTVLAVALGMLCGLAEAQSVVCGPDSLATPYDSNDGQDGDIFDVVVSTEPNLGTPARGIVETGFSVNLDTDGIIEFCICDTGSFVGKETDPSSFSVDFPAAAGTVRMQGYGIDPSAPDGVVFTRATQMNAL